MLHTLIIESLCSQKNEISLSVIAFKYKYKLLVFIKLHSEIFLKIRLKSFIKYFSFISDYRGFSRNSFTKGIYNVIKLLAATPLEI